MAVVGINRVKLRDPGEPVIARVSQEFATVLRSQPGFQRVYVVRSGPSELVALTAWETAAHAQAAAEVVGSTLLPEIQPYVESQDRTVGEVQVEAWAESTLGGLRH